MTKKRPAGPRKYREDSWSAKRRHEQIQGSRATRGHDQRWWRSSTDRCAAHVESKNDGKHHEEVPYVEYEEDGEHHDVVLGVKYQGVAH